MEPNSFDRIAPAPIDLGAGRKPEAGMGRRGLDLRRALPALALGALVIIALGVVFLLPRLQPAVPPPVVVAPAASAPAAVGGVTAGASTETPPPDENARLAARTAAQDLLEQVREVETALKGMGVETWATAPFRNAVDAITRGERAYQSLDYAAARDAYQSALTQLQALQAQSAAVFADALTRGQHALDSGNGPDAAAAFGIALLIRPDDAAARKGAARAKTLPRVLDLVRQGESLQLAGDIAAAARHFQQAHDLDPDHAPARERLQAARAELGAAAYRAAMSAGFSALAAGDAARARGHFAEALRARPGAPEAVDALRQAETRATSAAIEQHLSAARGAEATEDWSAAVGAYEAALKLDQNLLAARNGIGIATARRELDLQLSAAIAQPERLGDDAVQQQAEDLLARAAAVSTPAAKLKRQVAVLTTLLAEARTPVPVTLISDGNTDVNLYRVGRQGKFTSRQLTLRPGRYVAVGTRTGYRDVRVEFTLTAAGGAAPVQVQCTQPVTAANR